MKKFLVIIVVAALGIVSCKKEESAKPLSVENATMGGGHVKDMSGMD